MMKGFKAMKKNKHITINLNESIYNDLVYIASQQNRNITNMAYLLLIDAIKKNIIDLIDLSKNDLINISQNQKEVDLYR